MIPFYVLYLLSPDQSRLPVDQGFVRLRDVVGIDDVSSLSFSFSLFLSLSLSLSLSLALYMWTVQVFKPKPDRQRQREREREREREINTLCLIHFHFLIHTHHQGDALPPHRLVLRAHIRTKCALQRERVCFCLFPSG